MSCENDDFNKFPRTMHISGSRGTEDDIYIENQKDYIGKECIFLEKIDGDNVGISIEYRKDILSASWRRN